MTGFDKAIDFEKLASKVEAIDVEIEKLQSKIVSLATNNKQYGDLADTILALRDEKEKLEMELAGQANDRRRMEEMTKFINEHQEVTEYSDLLVRRLIDKVTIFNDDIAVEFKSGINVGVVC